MSRLTRCADNFEEVSATEGVQVWGPDPDNQSRARQLLQRHVAHLPTEPQEIMRLYSKINREVGRHSRLINSTMNAIVVRQGMLPLLVDPSGVLSQDNLELS